ncbi:MAG TPA: guanylate kinase [Candidatus Blautia avicola]|uniref:Guanylate kinase n=1 Tax=Candidatus Blautia avicola TaxID=2838483 RepID=A0A9D2QTF9_9FIRM|nr:guanylate kinase [Candidatus Blautia avicola]
MGKIFYIMGKSSSGKDTIYKRLLEDPELELRNIILYTTRPMRQGEQPGREYYFVNEETFREYEEQGKIIEARTYQTVYGPWIYFTADDGQIQMEKRNYLGIGTLESYICMKEYFGEENLCPLYIEVEDGERLKRAIHREELQTEPKYAEMCRRFLADEEDFSEENLKRAGIVRRFQNMELESCVNELKNCIQKLQ